jgi:ABC-2 type transport system ATP-binding protein
MVSQNIIELVDLTKKYGSQMAVNHLNLSVREGEIFGLLGPNGAGKSTSILMMLGLTEPTSGSAKVCDIDAKVHPIEVKRKIGYLPENVGFYEDLNGLDNLMFTARLNRMPEKKANKRIEDLITRVGLEGAAQKKVGEYSRGMKQRLGIADVLLKNPEVIVLDEPTLGIDPKGMKELLELIFRLSKEEGLTVLLSSHHLYQVQQICDRVGLFVDGKLVAKGDIPQLSRKLFSNEPFVIEARITIPEKYKGNSSKSDLGRQNLKEGLKGINGVVEVSTENNLYKVYSSTDITAEIARLIIEKGAELNHLQKKEYGLDDIYYRYFLEKNGHG